MLIDVFNVEKRESAQKSKSKFNFFKYIEIKFSSGARHSSSPLRQISERSRLAYRIRATFKASKFV